MSSEQQQAHDALRAKTQSLEARLHELQQEREHLDATLHGLQQQQQQRTTDPALKFFPFSSKPDAMFWRELGDRKLNQYMLSDAPVDVWGAFSPGSRNHTAAWFEVRAGSFSPDAVKEHLFAQEHVAHGVLRNVNTLEQFKATDKHVLLRELFADILHDIESGRALETPGKVLNRFVLLTHADLKTHRYLYWFAFPVVEFGAKFAKPRVLDSQPLEEAYPGLLAAITPRLMREMADNPEEIFFALAHPLPSAGEGKDPVVRLKDIVFSSSTPTAPFTLLCLDPSPSSTHPGWPVRNLLFFSGYGNKGGLGLPPGTQLEVICIRDALIGATTEARHSVVWRFELPMSLPSEIVHTPTTVVGWEENAHGKVGPRLANLAEVLDHTRLSEAACNLNLKLMKWRAFPELKEEAIAQTKVLLLGAGTLGCAVARGLLGWGFRHITFVDNGRVSYSNPVRQSLFVASDCIPPAKFKAQVAAERCRDIHPTAVTESWVGSILMPGHGQDDTSQDEFNKLNHLIQTHDVVCLLTDTRESRWLPTLLGMACNKLVLNAALGFDSFVVMRHGASGGDSEKRLGCYFCSDVVAPRDSTHDRTLDQQCTVTRPGGAPMASALLVELLVSVLHHPDGPHAPAALEPSSAGQREQKLGMVPHQIRGSLATFRNDVIHFPAFRQCTACSPAVVHAFQTDGYAFVARVLSNPDVLEDLSGIRELKSACEVNEDDFVLDDDED